MARRPYFLEERLLFLAVGELVGEVRLLWGGGEGGGQSEVKGDVRGGVGGDLVAEAGPPLALLLILAPGSGVWGAGVYGTGGKRLKATKEKSSEGKTED